MTYREKLMQEHPEKLGLLDCVCPFAFNYEAGPNKDCEYTNCDACWDREMPETAEETKANDLVSHPSHYTSGGIECIDAIEAALSCHSDPDEAFLTGQVLKYMWRWPLKNGAEDLRKARWYLNRLIGKVEGK